MLGRALFSKIMGTIQLRACRRYSCTLSFMTNRSSLITAASTSMSRLSSSSMYPLRSSRPASARRWLLNTTASAARVVPSSPPVKVRSETGWSRRFYQYASRITHLHLLGDALRAGGRQPVTASRGRRAWGRGDGCPARRRQPRWRSRPTGIRRPAPAAHGSPTAGGSGQRPGATG